MSTLISESIMQHTKALNRSQAMGALTVDTSATYSGTAGRVPSILRHRLFFFVNGAVAPAGGTVSIYVTPPDSTEQFLVGVVTLVLNMAPIDYDGPVKSFTLVPASFDADKTFNVNVLSWQAD